MLRGGHLCILTDNKYFLLTPIDLWENADFTQVGGMYAQVQEVFSSKEEVLDYAKNELPNGKVNFFKADN